jgi:hypothetical protein
MDTFYMHLCKTGHDTKTVQKDWAVSSPPIKKTGLNPPIIIMILSTRQEQI